MLKLVLEAVNTVDLSCLGGRGAVSPESRHHGNLTIFRTLGSKLGQEKQQYYRYRSGLELLKFGLPHSDG